MSRARRSILAAMACVAAGTFVREARAETHVLTMQEAIAHALARNPSIGTAKASEDAAEARVDLVEIEAWPRIGVVGELNRSTLNAVPGALFPLAGIPVVSGPPGPSRLGWGEWQTAVGITAGWDLSELVRRPTLIDAAKANASSVEAQTQVQRLAVAVQAADAYLLAVGGKAIVDASEAGERRAKALADVVGALVTEKLRSDLDGARAEAELAAATAAVSRAKLENALRSQRLALAIGEPQWIVETKTGDLLDLPTAPPPKNNTTHPLIVALDAAIHASEARVDVVDLGYVPRIDILGAGWLRGSGYDLGGPNSGKAGGLLPDTPNWAVGVSATWSIGEIATTSARARVERADEAVLVAKKAEVEQTLATDEAAARATFDDALAVAKQMTVLVEASRKTEALARTRYDAGLVTLLEVADAQRALAAAERDEAVARIDARRAIVLLYRARGELAPLLGKNGGG